MKATRKTKYFPLQGGEDLVTALYSKRPGTQKYTKNFECDSGGRPKRIAGYERLDGQTSPSEASYWVIDFDQGQAEVSEGATVTGGTSGATGTALLDGVLESGSYAGSDAAGYLVLTEVSGTFEDDENLLVSAATVCVADGTAIEKAGTSDNHTTWLRAAVAAARANISAVPGSGTIRGVWQYNGVVYAFRDNATATATDMYKATTSGWSKVDLGSIINFDAGTAEIFAGETLTGGTSAATGEIKKVVVQSGTWAGNDAAGYIVLHSVTGDFQDNEPITTVSGSATADGADAEITLSTGGRYECINHNFYGHSGSIRMYGCDGVNNAFEFNGTTYTPIRTGMTVDKPSHIAAHKGHLFLSFTGGSVQHSSTGEPLEWSAITGAAELGLGEEVVGLTVMPNDVLAIHGRNAISLLYGTGVSDWELKSFTKESGAIEWSIQKFSDLIFFDNQGITSMGAVNSYGDFATSGISAIIMPLLEGKIPTFISSIRTKKKNQYRLYFSDKTGINLTFKDNKIVGFTRLEYDHVVSCTCQGEKSNGEERILFGSDDGMVYELDKGTSFDGEPIEAWLRTWLITLGNPERKKRFFKIALEKDGATEEGYWGVGTWGNFEWGEQGYQNPVSYLGEVSGGYEYAYYASEAYAEPYTLQGGIIHYSNGGLNR